MLHAHFMINFKKFLKERLLFSKREVDKLVLFREEWPYQMQLVKGVLKSLTCKLQSLWGMTPCI
jgi:hypothetical protein